MYDYIEKDQGVKLIPSKTLLRDGELFWMNRLKRSNPTDDDLILKIRIKKEDYDKNIVIYNILYKNEKIGHADVNKNKNIVFNVYIDEEYRRRGLANFVYNYIENDLNLKLKPSPSKYQLDDGKLFWQNRLKKIVK